MNTPSHFLMTAAAEKALPRVPIVKSAFLIGSIAPDVALWVLSIGGIIYYRFILGMSSGSTASILFDELYFQHPLWVGLHNFLHAPLILLMGLALTWRKRCNIGSRSRWLFWFLLACLGHSMVDILTHHDDGPLLLFPFDWTTRFYSPVSYWDDRHHGNWFQQFEIGLNLFLLFYLVAPKLLAKVRKRN